MISIATRERLRNPLSELTCVSIHTYYTPFPPNKHFTCFKKKKRFIHVIARISSLSSEYITFNYIVVQQSVYLFTTSKTFGMFLVSSIYEYSYYKYSYINHYVDAFSILMGKNLRVGFLGHMISVCLTL